MKKQKQKKSMSFDHFFLALSYCMANARRYTTHGDVLVAAFLFPVWEICTKKKCGNCEQCSISQKRAFNTIVFLQDIFFTGKPLPSRNLLNSLAVHFEVFDLPSHHVRLLPESLSFAQKIFEANKSEIRFAAEEVIGLYLKHRKKDVNEFGFCVDTGFGLTLQIPVE